jgi:hypothetical protein
MKTSTILTSIVICFVAMIGIGFAQIDDETKQQVIQVCSLKSIKANQEFSRNVRVMRAKRDAVTQKQRELDVAENAEDKTARQKELDELLADLNENNRKMIENYGFSLTRNYTMVIETAHIYMLVSDVEAGKFKKGQANADQE